MNNKDRERLLKNSKTCGAPFFFSLYAVMEILCNPWLLRVNCARGARALNVR